MAKATVASDWLAACAGCHMALLDIDERIVKLLEAVEFSSSPITDLKHPPKEGVTVGILSGAISNTRNVEVAKMFRERSQILIAIGDDGEIWLQKRPIDIRSVRANVERMLAENPQSGVVIQADKDARTGLLVDVMDQAQLAGAVAISVAADEKS